MGDDGFGPHVVRAFDDQFVVSPHVEVVDLGTPGLDLTPWLADADDVIVVDTIRADAAAGTVRIYQKEDIERHVPFARVGPHDPGLKETLLTLEFAGRAPRTLTLIGAVPQRVAIGTELTGPVRDAIPAALHAVRAALAEAGIEVRTRDRQSLTPDDYGCRLTEASARGRHGSSAT
jgi:hydrogenase maturation protease